MRGRWGSPEPFKQPDAASAPVDDAIPASSILLVRDGMHDGVPCVEVLLLERTLKSDYAGGAYVFPGGKVDAADRRLPAGRWSGLDLAGVTPSFEGLGEDEVLGFYVAAVRETFEEAGVLFATMSGREVTAADLADPAFVEARERLNARDDDFHWLEFLEAHDLVLDLGAVGHWSWWVTPDGAYKRFDTHFFVAAMPAVQAGAASHDEGETTDSIWLNPIAALEANEREEVTIIFPTRKNLEAVAPYSSAAELVAAAVGGLIETPRVQPRILVADGEVMVQHPDGSPPERV